MEGHISHQILEEETSLTPVIVIIPVLLQRQNVELFHFHDQMPIQKQLDISPSRMHMEHLPSHDDYEPPLMMRRVNRMKNVSLRLTYSLAALTAERVRIMKRRIQT